VPRGNEPLVMSEFGTWALPTLTALEQLYGPGEPWWFATGPRAARPTGLEQRFADQGLSRIWPSFDDLATDTQCLQFDALTYQIAQLRRHPDIAGYVITQLTDAFWEANGLLDVGGGPKALTDRLIDVNGPDVILADLDRWDYWDDEVLSVDICGSSSTHAGGPVTVRWQIECAEQTINGALPDLEWPTATAQRLATLRVKLPAVNRATLARLRLDVRDARGRRRATQSTTVAIVPSVRRRSLRSLRVRLADHPIPEVLESRLNSLGHEVVGVRQHPDVEVASALAVETSKRHCPMLLLARDPAAASADCGLRVVPRKTDDPDVADRSGNWISAFAWIDTACFEGVPRARLLGFPFSQVYPDHVIETSDEEIVGLAGLFVGWLNAPALLIAESKRRRLLATTFRLAPENGPLADLLLDELLQRAARRG
jgi:hypothetical protein